LQSRVTCMRQTYKCNADARDPAAPHRFLGICLADDVTVQPLHDLLRRQVGQVFESLLDNSSSCQVTSRRPVKPATLEKFVLYSVCCAPQTPTPGVSRAAWGSCRPCRRRRISTPSPAEGARRAPAAPPRQDLRRGLCHSLRLLTPRHGSLTLLCPRTMLLLLKCRRSTAQQTIGCWPRLTSEPRPSCRMRRRCSHRLPRTALIHRWARPRAMRRRRARCPGPAAGR